MKDKWFKMRCSQRDLDNIQELTKYTRSTKSVAVLMAVERWLDEWSLSGVSTLPHLPAPRPESGKGGE